MKCDVDIRKDLHARVVLSGGSSKSEYEESGQTIVHRKCF